MRYEPMLLTETQQLPQGDQWGYEAKLDGYRALAEVTPDRTLLLSRHGTNFTNRFATVTEQLPSALAAHSAVLDGEMVGFTEDGRPSFDVLRKKHIRVVYFIFDLLELDDETLINEPLHHRRHILSELLEPQTAVQPSQMFFDREAITHAAQELDFEGVVAKELSSLYLPGKRSKNWLKWILKRHTEGWKHD